MSAPGTKVDARASAAVLKQFNDFGVRLEQARLAAGLDKRSLAARVCTSRNLITYYESGYNAPNLLMLLRLAEGLGCPVGWLAAGEGERCPPRP